MENHLTALAENIARRAHAGQVCKSGGDYIRHPERVAYLVSESAKPVAWLHDVLEETSLTAADLISESFPLEIITSVLIITRSEREMYLHYISRVAESGNQDAIEVKLADLRDNLRPGCPKGLEERYLAAIRILLPFAIAR